MAFEKTPSGKDAMREALASGTILHTLALTLVPDGDAVMGTKQSTPTSLDAELDGRDVCIEFTRVTRWSTDYHYGADADGRRGVSVTEIDEDYAEATFITERVDTADGTREITTQLAELTSLQALEVQRLVDEWLEGHEPAEPEEEDDCDYDDQDD